ncbi:hypothetical protein A4G16_02680 [Mannheimia granulomatis]|uniref:HTH cro/C1-type domain-containing protein n=1 Tax=Mannheimia granulomatis TaxID=85402 RepID=A0A6G8JGQ5_9PAST|nr:helix-turn-helix transcriptional regulator [Mannheimia granulomatis]QIM66355.1 hypothetical protein A4G16_02680 [Mannheimia granulomatis]
MNTSEKFKRLIKALGFASVKEFAEDLDISQARITDVMREKQKMPEDLLLKLISQYHVNANWLIASVGDMFIGNIPESALTKQEQVLLDDYRESNEQGKEAIEKTASALAQAALLANSKIA